MENVVRFFRAVTTEVHPDIKIDYDSQNPQIQVALQKEWNGLLEYVVANPGIVKKREEKEFAGSDYIYGHTLLTLEIDSVVMEIEGPRWEKKVPKGQVRYPTAQEQADTELNQITMRLSWVLAHASMEQKRILYGTIKASLNEPDTDIVNKTTDEVLRRLLARQVLKTE